MALSTLSIAKSVGLTDYYKKPFREKATKELWPMKSVWTMGTTTRGQEQMYGMAGLPMASAVGELSTPLIYDLTELGATTITIMQYGIGSRASHAALTDSDRNLGDLAGMIGESLGESLSQATSNFATLFFNRLTNSSYKAHDSVVYCSNSHTLEDGSTFDNLYSTSTNTYDNVLADVSAYHWNHRTHAGGYKYDDVGVIMVGPSLDVTYEKLFENGEWEPDTTDRNKNFLGRKGIQIVVNPFISSTTQRIYLGKEFKKHAFLLWREKMQSDQEPEKGTRGVIFYAWERLGYGVDDYLQVALNTGV